MQSQTQQPVSRTPESARSGAPESGSPAAGEYLTLKLGAEEYGIDILKVQEIRSYEQPTRIANAPEFIKGVINLRGVIVPIVDLRLKFGQEATYNTFTVVVVLNVEDRVVGVVVDSVSDVVELRTEHMREVPRLDAVVDASFITGLATLDSGNGERLIILTDIDRLVAGTDVGVAETAAAVH